MENTTRYGNNLASIVFCLNLATSFFQHIFMQYSGKVTILSSISKVVVKTFYIVVELQSLIFSLKALVVSSYFHYNFIKLCVFSIQLHIFQTDFHFFLQFSSNIVIFPSVQLIQCLFYLLNFFSTVASLHCDQFSF